MLSLIMSVFGLVHVAISIALCVIFAKLLTGVVRRDKREALARDVSGPGAVVQPDGSTMILAGGDSPFPDASPPRVMPEMAAPAASSTRRSSSAEVARTNVVRRVTISTVIAVASTLLCYANFALSFTNWLYMLVLDSIVNDLCLLYVASFSEVEDAAHAQEAELASTAEVMVTGRPLEGQQAV